MFVVAVTTLATPVEVEAPLLSVDLGMTVYDAALLLRAPSPSIVLRTDDRAKALALLGVLRGRGHETVACDDHAVVASDAMHVVRDFALEADALVDGGERLAWSDVTALVRAFQSARVETTEKVEGTKISIGRAALTGGLLSTKKVESSRTRVAQTRESVLYLFTTSRPWLVIASRARYQALGAGLRRLSSRTSSASSASCFRDAPVRPSTIVSSR